MDLEKDMWVYYIVYFYDAGNGSLFSVQGAEFKFHRKIESGQDINDIASLIQSKLNIKSVAIINFILLRRGN